MGKGDKQETRGQHECLDADGAERGGSGFVGKMDSSLDRAVEREQDVSPAFQPEIRGQWGGSQLIPRTCGGDRFPLRQETKGKACCKKWPEKQGTLLFLEWESQRAQWLLRGERYCTVGHDGAGGLHLRCSLGNLRVYRAW